jgi:hemerythrin-like domain-containing protein
VTGVTSYGAALVALWLRYAENRTNMLRDKNLIPLSHQHQHCLALCVRLDRAIQAGEVDLEAWQAEIQQIFEQEITFHFAAEEKELFPAAARFPELQPLVQELVTGHILLRDFFSRAAVRKLHVAGLQALVEKLASHIRKEERELFEGMQRLMSPEELSLVGVALQESLTGASNACILPTAATRLRPKQ